MDARTGQRRPAGTFQRLVGGIDGFQAGRPWAAVPVAVVKKFGEDRAGNLAGLIAYYAFFSVFPLLLVLVTVLGFVLADDAQLRRDVLDSALAQFPVLGDQLRDNTGELEGSVFALVVGIGSALWAGIGVMKTAQDAMNDVWDVPIRQRPNLLVAVGRSFGMLVVLGGGVVGTTVLTGAMGAVGSSLVPRAAGVVLGTVLNVGIFLLAFRILTVRDVAVRRLVPGAVLAGVAWMVLQLLGGYLLDTQISKASQTYGAFAVVIGLLWWFYIQAQVVLAAAELNVVLANRLWPRSLTGDDRHTDRRTLRQHAKVEERAPDEQVDAHFDRDPADHETADGDPADHEKAT
jgi:YihY family inner membrane protein